MMLEKELKESNQIKAKRLASNLENQFITFYEAIDEAMLVFGNRRAGKTTTCHALCRSPLLSEMKAGELVYRSVASQFPEAKINSSPFAETNSPTIFCGVVKDNSSEKHKKIDIIDEPGFCLNESFFNTFESGYSHYLTLTKVKKAKFLLVFSKSQLTLAIERFKNCVLSFVRLFKNWDQVKYKVRRATSFLIAKTNPQLDSIHAIRNSLVQLMNNTGGFTAEQARQYQELIDQILTSNRVYWVDQPERNRQTLLQSQNILQKICDSSSFWQVSHESLSFSVIFSILSKIQSQKQIEFFQQHKCFIEFLGKRSEQIMMQHQGCFFNFIEALLNYSQKKQEEQALFQLMQKLNQKYIQADENSTKREYFMQKWLINSSQSDDQQEKSNSRTLKNVTKYINNLIQLSQNEYYRFQNSLEDVQRLKQQILTIFKKMQTLQLSARDLAILRTYNYIFVRLFEEQKIVLLMYYFSEDLISKVFQSRVHKFTETIITMFRDVLFPRLGGHSDAYQ